MTVWADLEALADTEAHLVSDGRFYELAALYERRAALLAALPRPLPAEAVEPLQRALALQLATADVLRARRGDVAAELGRLHRARDGVQGYARAADTRTG